MKRKKKREENTHGFRQISETNFEIPGIFALFENMDFCYERGSFTEVGREKKTEKKIKKLNNEARSAALLHLGSVFPHQFSSTLSSRFQLSKWETAWNSIKKQKHYSIPFNWNKNTTIKINQIIGKVIWSIKEPKPSMQNHLPTEVYLRCFF